MRILVFNVFNRHARGRGCAISLARIVRNLNTRRAYRGGSLAVLDLLRSAWHLDVAQVKPIHVAAFVEAQLQLQSRPTERLRLAALRMVFDWMVVGQVITANPAHAVRGPKIFAG